MGLVAPLLCAQLICNPANSKGILLYKTLDLALGSSASFRHFTYFFW